MYIIVFCDHHMVGKLAFCLCHRGFWDSASDTTSMKICNREKLQIKKGTLQQQPTQRRSTAPDILKHLKLCNGTNVLFYAFMARPLMTRSVVSAQLCKCILKDGHLQDCHSWRPFTLACWTMSILSPRCNSTVNI